MHGYQIMQELKSRSGGRWRPSAGSVYPTLQQLEDEQLVSVEEIDGRKTFQLTEYGRQAAATDPIPTGDAAWTGGRERGGDLHGLTRDSRSRPCRSPESALRQRFEAAAAS